MSKFIETIDKIDGTSRTVMHIIGVIVKIVVLIFIIIVTVLLAAFCSSERKVQENRTPIETTAPVFSPDYLSASSLEYDLNNGVDVTGKTVTINVTKLVPNSAFGYNIQTGDHLNFCSTHHPGVSEGDKLTVRIDEVNSIIGSYIIYYSALEKLTAKSTETQPPKVVEKPQTEIKETQQPTNVTEKPLNEFEEASIVGKRDFYVGTWEYDSIMKDGVTMTVEEFDKTYGTNNSDFYFVLMSYGRGKCYVEDGIYSFPWNVTEKGITIEGKDYIFDGEKLGVDFDGDVAYFSKFSESEDFPNPQKGGNKASSSNSSDSKTNSTTISENDIRPEFKEMMDKYEEFFDDYIAFMKKYNSTGSNDPMAALDMLQDYLDWLKKYGEVMEDFEAIGNSDLTRAETLYYAEVSLRIEKKLLTILS